MKKSSKKAARKSIKQVGRDPVIVIRVPGPIHKRIKTIAAESEESMAAAMGKLVQNAIEWKEMFADLQTFFRQRREEIRETLKGELPAGLLAKGWGTATINYKGRTVLAYVPPEADLPQNPIWYPTDQSDKESEQ
jgi:hypothetical protein